MSFIGTVALFWQSTYVMDFIHYTIHHSNLRGILAYDTHLHELTFRWLHGETIFMVKTLVLATYIEESCIKGTLWEKNPQM